MKTLVHQSVYDVVAAVSDPEFPGVSIADLGIFESVRVVEGRVEIDLIPTFLGCPALGVIEEDVSAAARTVPGVDEVVVTFCSEPVWTPQRITEEGKRRLAEEFTVAVRSEQITVCPVCGAQSVTERSPFGPTACRAIAYCNGCRNPVEVMRDRPLI